MAYIDGKSIPRPHDRDIPSAITFARSIADREKRPVNVELNGYPFVVNPGQGQEEIVQGYNLGLARRDAEEMRRRLPLEEEPDGTIVAEAKCIPCDGTGVYLTENLPEGVGLVCRDCGGSGRNDIDYIPFAERKPRPGIRTIHFPGIPQATVTYKEFLEGKLP